ncbi:MAG TPA: A/G-specific adenine glycosylase [Opitutaceae bacterium]|nr:A/G-specific adenine glycosylase [Opitutaceae bacterium]
MTSAAPTLLQHRREFQTALLGWFEHAQRPLPWRTRPSAYRTVISEFMLQQTQVKTVLPYFARWMEAFPDFATLAAAPEDAVLKQWEGLGYYSRARNLHRLAKAVASLPSLPQTTEAWLDLPGVGPYTAAAVTSIAFGTPAACVDGNVVRILARLTADDREFRDSASAAKAFAPLAQAILSPDNPGSHNQAMMELGATVCFRQKPMCLTCPVRPWCAGARTGNPEQFPRLAAKKFEELTVHRVWLIRREQLLLHRAPPDAKRFANMYELPTVEMLGLKPGQFTEKPPLLKKKRGITRYRITELVHALPATTTLPTHPELCWVPLVNVEKISLSGPHRRWVTELLKMPSA